MTSKNGNQTVHADPEEPPLTARPESANSKPSDNEDKDVGKAPASRRKMALLIGIGMVVAVTAAYFIRNAFLYEDTDDAHVDGHIMPLSARINGQVEKVNVIEGQVVQAGDVLVVIDSKDYKVANDQALANLADAEATATSSHYNVPITSASAYSGLDSTQTAMKNAEAGLAAAKQNLQADQAGLQQAQANAAKTDADLVRYEQLVRKEDISRQQYDAALAAARANQAPWYPLRPS